MRDDDFRLFSNGGCEWGSWDDNSCREPHERSGACAYFDAWPVCGAMQFRVWHIKKDLNIELKGEGYKIKKRECVYHPDEYEGEDLSTYCTTFVFNLTQPKDRSRYLYLLKLCGMITPQSNGKMASSMISIIAKPILK